METVSVRGMTPAVKQERQLLPPVKPRKAPISSEIVIEEVDKGNNYLDVGIDEDLGIE
jgi:hypothetical protein